MGSTWAHSRADARGGLSKCRSSNLFSKSCILEKDPYTNTLWPALASANIWVKLKVLVLIHKVLNGLALLPWNLPSFPSFVVGSFRHLVWVHCQWKCEGLEAAGKRNRDKERREKTAHLDVNQSMRVCCEGHHFTWVPAWFPSHDCSMNTLTTEAKIQPLTS